MSLSNLVDIIAAVLLITSIVAFYKYYKVTTKYGALIDVDAEVVKLRREIEEQARQRDAAASQESSRREQLNSQYRDALAIYEKLKKEVALVEENLEDMSFGVYKPHFTFDTSEKYKEALEKIWEQKKEMIHAEKAAVCATQWSVKGSRQEGKRMEKKAIKLMLRAFNGETDAAVAKVTWNNVTRMEERVRKAYEAINELGSVNTIRIAPDYLELALAELRLSHEYERKKYDEREEQREIREQMREEERAQREYEKAQQEAATEEQRYKKALERARAEVEKARGDEIARAEERMRELEQKLAEVQARGERAKSMAEQTKCGYIYIISNVGSFGDQVFKIGMTRRLEPMDRVHELGDASVPFQFDVHAMIYSTDAPKLERAFHQRVEANRVNLVNPRKEFFSLALDELEQFAREQKVTVEFTKLAEAREYRETVAIRAKAAAASNQREPEKSPFPDRLLSEALPAAP